MFCGSVILVLQHDVSYVTAKHVPASSDSTGSFVISISHLTMLCCLLVPIPSLVSWLCLNERQAGSQHPA